MADTASQEFTLGRYDIKIPVFEPQFAYTKVNDVFLFFHRLWELNVSPILDEDGYPQQFQRDLGVPASRFQPAVVISGHYTPVSAVGQAANAFENAIHNSNPDRFDDAPEVVTARESHSIRTLPAHKVGTVVTILSAEYDHRHQLIPYGAKENPEVYEGVRGINRHLYSREAYSEARESGLDVAQPDPEVEGQVMRGLVQDVIRLLSTVRGQE
jgi:hypothetical protein